MLEEVPPGTVRVGLVATFASWKGHDLFLEAVKGLSEYDARFYIVGGSLYSTSGSQRTLDQLRRRVLELKLHDRVGIVPFQRDPACVYAALDVVVHASTKPEPFGRVVSEGMSAGRAVVAVASGGVLEQIEDERTGLLFPIGNSQALTKQLRRLLESASLRASLGNAAYQYATTHLDAARLGAEINEIYTQLRRH